MSANLRWSNVALAPPGQVDDYSEVTNSIAAPDSVASSFITGNTIVHSNREWSHHTNSSEGSRSVLYKLNFETLTSTLYGREQEMQILKAAFQETIREPRAKQVVLIKGEAGSGKSSLADTLRQGVATHDNSFFLMGKYEQQQQQQQEGSISGTYLKQKPHSGITSALQQLWQALLEHRFGSPTDEQEEPNDDSDTKSKWTFTFEDIRSKLVDQIGMEDLSLMYSFMPRLKFVIEAGSPANVGALDEAATTNNQTASGYQERKRRFFGAIRQLIKILRAFGPVVLCLDDLQWSDPSSLELFECLVSDDNNSNEADDPILIIGIYRSDEVSKEHPLSKLLQELNVEPTPESERKDDSTSTTTTTETQSIHLQDLDLATVQDMLAHLLHCDKHAALQSLAECIHRKTNGNPFYVGQYLRSLEANAMLRCNPRGVWIWDVEEIRAFTSSTENVIDFMVSKLRGLPPETTNLLPMVASLGSTFHEDLVCLLVREFQGENNRIDRNNTPDWPNKETKLFLKKCEREGLIVPLRDGYHQWEHDKVQEAALKLVELVNQKSFSLKIGELLLNNLDEDGLEENLFVIANLLEEAASTLEGPRKMRIIKSNLEAGRKSFEASAFHQAMAYLENAIKLLPADHWDVHYELSLEIYSTAAEAEFTVGRFDLARSHCGVILSNGTSIMDKRRAYDVMILCQKSEGRLHDGKTLCVKVLKQLGIRFPKQGVALYVLWNVIRTRVSLKKTSEVISTFDQVSDALIVWKMRLLHFMAYFCYQADPDLLPLIIARGYQFTTKNGITKYAPQFLSLIGLLSVVLGDFKAAKIYAEKASSLLEKVDDARSVEALTVFVLSTFVWYWQQPCEWCSKPLLRGYHMGMAVGDTENASWCVWSYLEMMFLQGAPLVALASDCQTFTRSVAAVHQRKIENFIRCFWQLLLNLIGESEGENVLEGNALNEAELEAEIVEKKDEHLQTQLDRVRIMASFWFGDYKQCQNLAKSTGSDKGAFDEKNPALFTSAPLAFCMALSAFVTAGEVTGTRKSRKFKSLGSKNLSRISGWAKAGNPNVVHYESILQAEKAALLGKQVEAKRAFEVAILLCQSRGLKGDEALTRQRYAVFSAKSGASKEARSQIEAALSLYEEWGAAAVSGRLRTKYANLIDDPTLPVLINTNVEAPVSQPELFLEH